MYIYDYIYIICRDDVWMEVYTACGDDGRVHVCVHCTVVFCADGGHGGAAGETAVADGHFD